MSSTYQITRPPHRITCVTDVEHDVAESWLAEFTTWFGADRRAVPSAPEKERLAVASTPLGDVLVKRELRESVRGAVQTLGLQRSNSARAFWSGLALVAADVPTPQPLALIERRGWALHSDATLIQVYVPGLKPWKYLAAQEDAERARARLWASLATTLGRMHQVGFLQPDLKNGNLHVTVSGEGAPIVQVIDLDRVEGGPRPAPTAKRLRELGRLCASFSSANARAAGVTADDWIAFARAYLAELNGRAPDERDVGDFVEATTRHAQKKIAENERRGRRIS